MDKHVQRVYETLTGNLVEGCCVPGVENAFEENSYCMNLYGEMLNAYSRVLERLGLADEDDDIEIIIINNLLDISEYLSGKMYHYGSVFSRKNTENK